MSPSVAGQGEPDKPARDNCDGFVRNRLQGRVRTGFAKYDCEMPPKSAHLREIDWKGALNQAVDEKYWPIARLNV